jgi:predicted lipoprotein with Yx(FWY)xxD motif
MRFVGKALIRRYGVLIGAGALSAGAVGGVIPSLGSAAAAAPRASAVVLQSINVSKYPGVLGNSKGYSLYLLANEKGGKLHCSGQCLQYWLPLYVSKDAMITVGKGVKGKWSTVERRLSSADKFQVTYNSYPVYTYVGDTGAKQSHGEGVKFSTGVDWYLVRASATAAATTPMKTASDSSGGGGGGW